MSITVYFYILIIFLALSILYVSLWCSRKRLNNSKKYLYYRCSNLFSKLEIFFKIINIEISSFTKNNIYIKYPML